MTQLTVIRHGLTDFNVERRFQGQVDPPLNATGIAQAQRLARRLGAERFDRLVCSDLLRTRQTAAPLIDALGLDSEHSTALREQHFGVLDGLLPADAMSMHPEHWQRWLAFDADYAIPGGESTRAFHDRIRAAILDLAARFPDANLAIVTHGGALDMIWRIANRESLHGPRRCDIPNTGINHVRAHAGRLEIVGWADAAHIEDLLAPQPTSA